MLDRLDRLELGLIEHQSVRARLTLVQAEIEGLRGRPVTAEPKVLAALAMFENSGDPIGCGDARSTLVTLSSDGGDPARRDACLQQCLADYRLTGDSDRIKFSLARGLLFQAFRDARSTGLSLAEQFDPSQDHGAIVTPMLASVRAVVAGYTGE